MHTQSKAMTTPAAPTYKATKPEWYMAIGQALDDPAMATATDASILQEIQMQNPNWVPCKKTKFKKYYKRVIAAKEAGIDPKDAGNLVSDDASVSTIGSMASRAKNFIVSKTSGTISGGSGSPTKTGSSPSRSISASKQDDVSDIASTTTGKTFGSIKKKLGSIKKSMKSSPSSTPRVPGSIGGPFFSPSPLKEEPIREDGVEYSAVPPPILSDGTADITPDHSDRELDLSTSAYVDENDGTKDKKDECCSQGCIIL